MIELTFNTYSLLISVALVISLTFGFLLLFNRHQNKIADRFLAAVIFIVSFWNASILILDLNLYQYAAGVVWIPMSFTLALGPCFYFYIRFISDYEESKKVSLGPHFIPVLLQVALFLIEVFQGLPQGKGYYETDVYLIFEPLVSFLAIISFLVYSYLARNRINNYHHWVNENYSHAHRYNLNWLYRLSSIFLYLLVVWLAFFIFDYFLLDYQLSFFDYYPLHLILAAISIWLCAEAFLKPEIIFPEFKSSEHEDQSSSIPNKEIKEKARWLKDQIANNLLFLDAELSLRSLADILNIHPNLVSRIINEGLNQSFSDLINEFRVQAVMHKLKDPDLKKSTLLAIAFDCGFNSKTTFNRVFKKRVGQTPLQFSKTISKL